VDRSRRIADVREHGVQGRRPTLGRTAGTDEIARVEGRHGTLGVARAGTDRTAGRASRSDDKRPLPARAGGPVGVTKAYQKNSLLRAAAIWRWHRNGIWVVAYRLPTRQGVGVPLGLAQAARKVRPHAAYELVRLLPIWKETPHPSFAIKRLGDRSRSLGAKRCGPHSTPMPLESDEDRRVSA
jgi:hypothetical protein